MPIKSGEGAQTNYNNNNKLLRGALQISLE